MHNQSITASFSTSLLAYTTVRDQYYTNPAYPGLRGLNCDLDDAIHLALVTANGTPITLHDGTGVIFARADYSIDDPRAATRTFVDPWAFRTRDGSIAFCAVRRGESVPDPASRGTIAIIVVDGAVDFREPIFITVSNHDVRNPTCQYDTITDRYTLTWMENGEILQGISRHLGEVFDISHALPETLSRVESARDTARLAAAGIPNSVAGNLLPLRSGEEMAMRNRFGEIRHVGVTPIRIEVSRSRKPRLEELPWVDCVYSDGSHHRKPVTWDRSRFDAIDWSRPGTYTLEGNIRTRRHSFPFIDDFISDPCITRYGDRYFLSATNTNSIAFRISNTIEGLRDARPIEVFHMDGGPDGEANLWAQEMHVIRGVPYVFTTVGCAGWSSVQCHVFRCNGDPADPKAWEPPHRVVMANGEPLYDNTGIGLDMTYFEVEGVHYVMWSGRRFFDKTPGAEVMEPADVRIATVDPDEPWRLTSEPQQVVRPEYGWDRCQSEVDEGPYLLRHGDDLFVTISGASTALPDLYCLGLLHAKAGENLLDPSAWRWFGYPVLTKESVPGEYGPGHNMFIKDPETGDDLIVYHAVPHDVEGRSIGRRMGIRRVHWTTEGLPYLAMTPTRDLNPDLARITATITVI